MLLKLRSLILPSGKGLTLLSNNIFFLYLTKLKAFAEVGSKVFQIMGFVSERVENVGKEKCWPPASSPLATMFLKDFSVLLKHIFM